VNVGAIDLLVKLSQLTDYRAADARWALGRAFGALAAEPDSAATLEAQWLRWLGMTLISARFPQDFIDDAAWHFLPGLIQGWHDPALLRSYKSALRL
jgi:hypothetical protein